MLTRSLLSRTLLLKTIKNAANSAKQPKRNGGHGAWTYRVPPPMPSKSVLLRAEILGGLCWWWILYHIATEPEHVYGEWPYIDPSTWSDTELGIPPDTEGSFRK